MLPPTFLGATEAVVIVLMILVPIAAIYVAIKLFQGVQAFQEGKNSR